MWYYVVMASLVSQPKIGPWGLGQPTQVASQLATHSRSLYVIVGKFGQHLHHGSTMKYNEAHDKAHVFGLLQDKRRRD